jgi:hypothetical protein
MSSQHDAVPCDNCGAQIVWTITAANRTRMAVNADPDPTGNQAVYRDDLGRLRSRGLTRERPTPEHAEWQAMPHVATCTSPQPRQPRPRRRPGVRPVRWQR